MYLKIQMYLKNSDLKKKMFHSKKQFKIFKHFVLFVFNITSPSRSFINLVKTIFALFEDYNIYYRPHNGIVGL